MAVDNVARGMAAAAMSGGGGGGGSSALSGLTDVDISNPTNGQTLVYNATSGKWENGGSSGGGVLVANFDLNTESLDKTWSEIASAPFTVINTATENWIGYDAVLLCIRHDEQGEYPDYSISAGTMGLLVAPSENGYPVIPHE